MLKYSIIILILLSSCKVKKEVNKVQIKEEVKEVQSTNWVRKENVFSKVDGTAQIEFEGLQDFSIDWQGNISVVAESAVMGLKMTKTDTVVVVDSVVVESVTEKVVQIKSKEVKKKTTLNLWLYIIIFGIVFVLIFYVKNSKKYI